MANLQILLDWIAANPETSGLAVFLIAFSESLVGVGLLMPGAALLFGVGALIATGTIDLVMALSAAFLGALAGDGLSFWLGHHYSDQLRHMWPMSKYPEAVAKGETFFYRHGRLSIFIGRFVGPIRPVIPATAGMLGMPVRHYIPINIIASLLWSPAYLLPGMFAGKSLGVLVGKIDHWLLPGTVIVITVATVIWLSRR
jgi:undecaprenyl-diphosphatase